MSEGKGRIRGVWPDPEEVPTGRARHVALAYRRLAREQQQRAQALQDALTAVDLRMLEFSDADLAATVRKLIQDVVGDPVRDLDAQFADWGEDFHLDGDEPPAFEYDDTDYVPSRIIAELFQISNNYYGQLRIGGVVKDFLHRGTQGYVYNVGEARAVKAQLPGRAAGGANKNRPPLLPPRRRPRKKG